MRGVVGSAVVAIEVALAGLTVVAGGSLEAQELDRGPEQVRVDLEEYELPRWIRQDVRSVNEDQNTARYEGEMYVAAAAVIEHGMIVVEGGLVVDGVIEGDVVVVNGDLELGPDAVLGGDVFVVGGALVGRGIGVAGATVVSPQRAERRVRGRRSQVSRADTDASVHEPERRSRRSRNRGRRGGDADIAVRVGPTYNRTEGLPIGIGPRFRTRGSAPFEFEALGIWRTATSFDSDNDDVDSDELGYTVRLEQRFGYDTQTLFGGRLYRVTDPIERWGLRDTEASLATLVLGDDYRDHFDREGWSVYGGVRDTDSGLRFTLEYRDEDYTFRPVANPWTVGDGAPWRPQPLVAEGNLRSLGAELVWSFPDYDRYNDSGWELRARGRWGLDGSLATPMHAAASGVDVPTTAFEAEQLQYGLLDLRRRTSLGWNNRLDLRVLVGGSLNDDPLPPQFQHAFGGVGSVPGHSIMAGDCGARSQRSTLNRASREQMVQPTYSNYGCDRFALFQAEYRGGLDFHFDWDDDRDRNRDPDNWGNWEEWDRGGRGFDTTFEWSVFFDAGRGWVQSVDDPAVPRFDTETLMDVGAGFWIGEVGFLAAVPLDSDSLEWRYFIRLEHRF